MPLSRFRYVTAVSRLRPRPRLTLMTGPDVDILLEQARAGDGHAFARLVRTFEPQLRLAAFRLLRDSDRIDDVMQDVFLRAYQGLPRFRGDASIRTWLHRITTNVCLDAIRRRRPVESLDDIDRPEAPAAGPDPAERALTRHALSAAIDELPTEQRAIVVLVDVEDADYSTVSRLLGIPTGTVASRLNRARRRLRETVDAA